MSQKYQIKQYAYEGLHGKQEEMFKKTNAQMLCQKCAEEVKEIDKFCGKGDEKQ